MGSATCNDSPIAIVGLSYRAPGVGGKGLWNFLAEAKSAWSKVPAERFDHDAFYHPDSSKAGTISSEGAHFLPGNIFSYDAPFFNLRPDEAHAIDPQHRILLECALEAAENAGLTLVDLAGSNVGVFSAIGSTEFEHQSSEDLFSTTPWTALGVAPCMFANRLSYFFDLKGPSISLDAACASSSYAMHLACQNLRAGECNAAFVGASTLLLGPNQWNCLDKLGALSPEGKSLSYDSKASGFGRGEGAACLIVKRLEDAISAGDPIHAIVRNSACSHNGRSDGITMPSRPVQEDLILRVHKEIGLNPLKTPVIEGHGTGTQAGDPIEAGAFAAVLARDRTPSNPLYIGSIKSNIGHLEGTSGILGIVKAIMMIQRGRILPNAGFEEFNHHIEGREKLKVATTVLPWPSNAPKRVLVTNFGFGGSNAAVLLEEAPTSLRPSRGIANGTVYTNGYSMNSNTTNGYITNGHTTNGYSTNGNYINDNYTNATSMNGSNTNGTSVNGNGHVIDTVGHDHDDSASQLFVLSAKTESSLTSYLSSFSEYLDTAPKTSSFATDLSFTLGQRRTHYAYRIAVVADSVSGLKDQLSTFKPSKAKDRPIAFAFTGQGAQHAQMAAGLRRYKPFAIAIDQAEAHLSAMGATWSLTEELKKPAVESRINEAEISQPACTAVQLALLNLLKSWGVTATAVTGHSSGEIAAAYAAGLVSFRAAVAISYFRGQVSAQLSQKQDKKGAMLALGTSPEVASTLIQQNFNGYAVIAAINSPQSVTISGDESAIENIKQIADIEGLFARKLKVDVAYHSEHMEPAAASYLASIKPFVNAERPSIRQDDSYPIFVSSVTGCIEGADTIDASYWIKNLLQPVRFADAITSVFSPRDTDVNAASRNAKLPSVIVEIGPHSALQTPIKQTVDSLRKREKSDQKLVQFTSLASLIRDTNANEALLRLAGSLFSIGSPINLAAVNQIDRHDAHVLTDLPPYAWDKSVNYPLKSRIARESLHPGPPFASLVGRKSMYGSANETAFRHVFTFDDIPWIRDHKVAKLVILPMTGYVSMAIEALRRVSPNVQSSILVREFHVKRSLDIEEGGRVDIMTKLEPAPTGTENSSSTVWIFKISSWSEENGWTSHCHGQIEQEANDITIENPTIKASIPLISSESKKELDAELEYASLGQGGTVYGPSFRSMRKIWEGPDFSVMETELRDFDLSQPWTFGSPITVDPPTLDSHLQGIGPFQGRAAYMPNYVSRLRISNKIPATKKQRFTIVTRMLNHDTRGGKLRTSVAVFAQSDGSLVPVCEWESVTYRSISSSDASEMASSLPAGYCWDLIPSMDFASDEYLSKMVSLDPNELEIARQKRRKVNTAGVYYMHQALKETGGDDFSHLSPHLARYLNWSKTVVARENLDFNDEPSSLLAEVANSDAQGEMICAVGKQLPSILRGTVQPLEIMLKDNLLMRNYEQEAAIAHCSQVLGRFVSSLSDIKPDLSVLEIGGGTASATFPVLEELSRGAEGLPAFLNYTFTDISSGFFENARTKLAKWTQNITFKRLDIGQDPAQQGFTTEHYDVVIASNVLHATPNIATTLDHVRTLLKPNGKLLLIEATRHAPLCLPFSLLPGWWLSEDEYRNLEEGPLLSEEAWQRVLLAKGFSGLDVKMADYHGDVEHVMSVMCSTRVGIEKASDNAGSITICGLIEDHEDEEFAQMVSDQVAQHLGCLSTVKPLSEIDVADDPYCIFIDSPRHSIMADLSEEIFEVLKNTLLQTKGLLWIVPENCHPEAESIVGLLRTVRHETQSRNLLFLRNAPFTHEGSQAITQLARRLRDLELANAAGIRDQDFVWQEGKIQVPRFRQLTEARDVFASEAGIPVRKMQNIWKGDDSLEMTVDSAGSPDYMYFRKNDVRTRPLDPDEVLVKVEATGVNFRDLLLVLGSIPWTKPGFEGAGVITQTGSDVTDVKTGDRVFYGSLAGGAFGTYVRIPSWRACKVPDDMSSADAASISVAYSTAIFSIMRVGRLRKGESVLIHAASGAVGQACIFLAQHIGATIFATAGSPAKRGFLHETFGIPTEHIFSSRTPEFRDGIMNVTDGKGVDVIVNCLSGNLLQETWALIADFGRFVEIGKRDLLQNSYLGMRPFDRNVTFSGVDLRTLFNKRPEEEKECLQDLVNLLQHKVIVPIHPVTTIPISDLVKGLRKLQSGQNIGKIVATIGPDDSVQAESPPVLDVPAGELLKPDATYLITGGTGGIGRSLASWMVKNGARNVVLLGRSGSSRPEVKKLLEEYEDIDVHMRAIACDVGSREELISALQSIQDLPPARGIVHGALYLRDSLLENATFDDWQKITRPRVQGAWNLHELVENVDFFISLSSFVGSVGNVGQGIYASTTAFFDAFTQYRLARGLPSVAIALPVVLDVGYAVEMNLTEALKVSLGATLTEADLHATVKGAIIGPSSGLNHDGAAISFRFASGEDPNELGWKYYHPLALAERVNARQRRSVTENQGGDARLNGQQAANNTDTLPGLLEAVMDKVSSITMIERDEVEPDAPLSNYSLDSLVSVELRNWIRRQTGIELALPEIVGSANLRALATHILSQRETRK